MSDSKLCYERVSKNKKKSCFILVVSLSTLWILRHCRQTGKRQALIN